MKWCYNIIERTGNLSLELTTVAASSRVG